MICTNCGTDNPTGRRFCDNCGSALAVACPNCGEPNRPDARFCGNCGQSLSAATPSPVAQSSAARTGDVAERRLVSVLFADLVGFTPFAEERDAEEVRDILSRYFETARTVIERHGGTVEKFIGDAVMAVWGTPLAHEDDAERAVRAALELIPAVKGVDEQLQARAGVLSGEAAISLGATDQGMLAGDLVNSAARLQSVAAPGSVLVGESTMRAAGPAIAFESAGEQQLKGKTSPVPAWLALRVVAERGGRSRTDMLEPPFSGRDTQLTLLKELLHATGREGRARLVAVTGPGGIGKSRLAWELEKYVDGVVESIYWHAGRSPSYGEGVSFWALGEMVRRRCGLAEQDDEATTRQQVGLTLAEYIRDEQDRRWVEPALLALLGVEQPPPGGREVLFAAWRIFFERIAERGTTVLLFEDLQYADSGLLDFVDYLLEWSRNAPIMILALARPELLERRPEFGSATRHFNSMPLEPLRDEDMRQLLAGIVPDLEESVVEAIVARADGIPLYAVETIRMLIADGRMEACGDGTCRMLEKVGELAIPDSLRSLIASRLDALDPIDRLLLQQASVLGQTFTLDSLAAVAGAPGDDLAQRLRGLVRREILALEADPRSPERGQYGFVQGLIREVAYGTLSRRDRRERHLAAARFYEALGDDETAGTLATHYLAAYEASERGAEADAVATQARLALRGAAERASALGAYAQAMQHLEQALAVTQAAADRADLLERAAWAAEKDAHYERGTELVREAIEAYREVGDDRGRARAAGLLGTLLVDAANHGEAIEVFQAALRDLPADEAELRAELNARLARPLMRSRQDVAAILAADEALAIAEPRAMIQISAEALVNKGAALGNSGRWREGAAVGELAVRLAEDAGAADLHLRALNNLASALMDDEPARAVQITASALELARRLGLRGMFNWLAGTVGIGRFWEGRAWDEAVESLHEALAEAGNEMDEVRLATALLFFQYARGVRDDDLWRRVEAADFDDPALRAYIQAIRGERLLADEDLAAAFEEFVGAAQIHPADATPTISAIRTAAWLRDSERLAVAIGLLDTLPYSGRSVVAARRWATAAQAVIDGRRAEGTAGFVEAISMVRETGMDFEAARMALDAVILLPDEPAVAEWAPFARQIFERVGARFYLDRLDAALAGPGTSGAGAEEHGTVVRVQSG